jgi:hypothetical protein
VGLLSLAPSCWDMVMCGRAGEVVSKRMERIVRRGWHEDSMGKVDEQDCVLRKGFSTLAMIARRTYGGWCEGGGFWWDVNKKLLRRIAC